jgi:hypothetical protein
MVGSSDRGYGGLCGSGSCSALLPLSARPERFGLDGADEEPDDLAPSRYRGALALF